MEPEICKGCSALCEDCSGVEVADSDTVEKTDFGTVEKADCGTVEKADCDAVEESIGCSEATGERQDPLAALRYACLGSSHIHDQVSLAVVHASVSGMAVPTFHLGPACCVVTL